MADVLRRKTKKKNSRLQETFINFICAIGTGFRITGNRSIDFNLSEQIIDHRDAALVKLIFTEQT